MSSVAGRCYCQAIQFELMFPTRFFSHCHCEDCRRTHGAPFVSWTSVPREQFRLLSGKDLLKKYESHPGIRWSFCAKCGTPLFYESDETPNRIDIAASNLDGELDRPAQAHVSFEEHVPWLEVQDSLPKYRGKGQELIST